MIYIYFYQIFNSECHLSSLLIGSLYYGYSNYSLYLARKYAGIFVRGLISSKVRTVLREQSLSKAASFKEQITSEDKYTNIFLCKIEVVVCMKAILAVIDPTYIVVEIRLEINSGPYGI